MVQLCATMMQQQQQHITVSLNTDSENTLPSPPPPPPPLPPTPSHNRRPRVREVSSRFMSPSVSTISRRRQNQSSEGDENNRPIENSETLIGNSNPNSNSHCKPNLGGNTNQRKQQRSVKLFKENNGNGRVEHVPVLPHPSKSCSGRIGIGVNNNNGFSTPCSRPDTPTIAVSSRYRITPQHRSSAATKLLQASGMSNNHQIKLSASSASALSQLDTNSDTYSVCSDDEDRDSDVSCSIQSLPELCSEGDVLPTVSTRSVAEKIGNRGVMSSNSGGGGDLKYHTPLSRSISLPSSSGNEHLVHSVKGSEKQQGCSLLSKQCGNQLNHGKVGGLALPPVPPCAKQATDTRKGKKGSGHQEDVHSMRLLYNRHLQWRFANAKAEANRRAQQRESEKALYSLAMKLSELRDSVNTKCIELGLLQRLQTLLKILDAQIPYLDEWSALEEDYSVSIAETIQALLNASVQLPTGGNVRVDLREMEEALNASLKMMETIVFHIERFMPKAEETDTSISELARVASGERALIGECGDL
ncbi:hypothetical protein RIF29_40922 [Crotalaria pallida]|uniref:Uncharacterized protein n=1 Tax=Crotalaria pallida TaxID=3830 RepID=A0AAN9E436_CROPI